MNKIAKSFITIDSKPYEYLVEYKNIKNVYLRIKDGFIYVTCNKRTSKKFIENFLINKKDWIIKQLNKEHRKEERTLLYSDQEFLNYIKVNVNKFSKRLDLYPKKVTIKKMKSAWGSCTSNRNISINKELMYYKEELVDYVIVHELSHLKYMNHSKDFWNLVGSVLPDYKALRKAPDRNSRDRRESPVPCRCRSRRSAVVPRARQENRRQPIGL